MLKLKNKLLTAWAVSIIGEKALGAAPQELVYFRKYRPFSKLRLLGILQICPLPFVCLLNFNLLPAPDYVKISSP
jgi:hypothetical protein